jgi:signal transduction protein with GAF and PtsI domain
MTEPIGRQVLPDDIENRLAGRAGEAGLLAVLDRVLQQFGCATGTIHRLDSASGMLRLCVQRGIPAALMDRVRLIPVGKGMAGIAAERRQPVQVCNLQTDTSGVAKPGAKETRMEGSIAVPMLVGEELRGVLGVAKPVAYDFTEAEIALLSQIAALIGKHLDR